MKFYTFGCSCCGTDRPLIKSNKKGDYIHMFSTMTLAQMEAVDFERKYKEKPLIIEVETKRLSTVLPIQVESTHGRDDSAGKTE